MPNIIGAVRVRVNRPRICNCSKEMQQEMRSIEYFINSPFLQTLDHRQAAIDGEDLTGHP